MRHDRSHSPIPGISVRTPGANLVRYRLPMVSSPRLSSTEVKFRETAELTRGAGRGLSGEGAMMEAIAFF